MSQSHTTSVPNPSPLPLSQRLNPIGISPSHPIRSLFQYSPTNFSDFLLSQPACVVLQFSSLFNTSFPYFCPILLPALITSFLSLGFHTCYSSLLATAKNFLQFSLATCSCYSCSLLGALLFGYSLPFLPWPLQPDRFSFSLGYQEKKKKKSYWLLESTFIFFSLGFSEVQTHLILMQNVGQDSEGSNAENINQKLVY